MPNFELLFETAMEKGRQPKTDGYDWRHTRIITVDDLTTAEAVAKAMLKEEVEAGEYLTKIIRISPSNKPAALYVWDGGQHCWSRVLTALKIHPDTIEYIWANVNGMNERIGFRKIKTAR